MKKIMKHTLLAISTVFALNVGTAQGEVTGTVKYMDTYSVNTMPTTMFVGVQTATGLVVLQYTGSGSAIPTIIDNAYRHGGSLTFEGFLPRIYQVSVGR